MNLNRTQPQTNSRRMLHQTYGTPDSAQRPSRPRATPPQDSRPHSLTNEASERVPAVSTPQTDLRNPSTLPSGSSSLPAPRRVPPQHVAAASATYTPATQQSSSGIFRRRLMNDLNRAVPSSTSESEPTDLHQPSPPSRVKPLAMVGEAAESSTDDDSDMESFLRKSSTSVSKSDIQTSISTSPNSQTTHGGRNSQSSTDTAPSRERPPQPATGANTAPPTHTPNKRSQNDMALSEVDEQLPSPARACGSAPILHPVGFGNLGNTCYMNATLQCLLRLAPMRRWLLSPACSEGSLTEQCSRPAPLTLAVRALCEAMHKSAGGSISPTQIKRAIGRTNRRFDGYDQQDAQELLRVAVETLHNETNLIKGSPKYKEMTDEPGERPIQTAQRWWQYQLSRGQSPVQDIFAGQWHGTSTCNTCNYVSTSFDQFQDVAVEIPRSGLSRTATTIEQCLTAFASPVKMTGDEQIFCTKCKKHRDGVVQLRFFRLPSILVIQLKRFRHSDYGGGSGIHAFGRASKVTDPVQFPLGEGHYLDMAPYLSPDSPYRKGTRYALRGVVNHSGSCHGGHYTAIAFNDADGKWYEYNDSSARHIVVDPQPSSTSAYVLFFEKVE